MDCIERCARSGVAASPRNTLQPWVSGAAGSLGVSAGENAPYSTRDARKSQVSSDLIRFLCSFNVACLVLRPVVSANPPVITAGMSLPADRGVMNFLKSANWGVHICDFHGIIME
jgi:hypothetical protein